MPRIFGIPLAYLPDSTNYPLNGLFMKKTFLLLISALALFSFQHANATPITLTFDSSSSGTSYTENGVTIASTSAEPVRTNGGWFLDCCNSGPESFSISTGGIFDLLSVFISHVDGSDPVIWNGFLNGALVATNSFNSGQGSTFNFSGFTGLDTVTMSVSGTWTDPSFDNLTFEVPVPSSLMLLGIGLAGIGFVRKKNT